MGSAAGRCAEHCLKAVQLEPGGAVKAPTHRDSAPECGDGRRYEIAGECVCERDRGEAAIGEPHRFRGPGRAQLLQKEADALVVGDELADLEVIAGFPAQGRRAQTVQLVGPASGVDGSIRCEFTTGITAPADEAQRAPLVSDREFGKVAPPAFGQLDLIALASASG